MARQFREQLEEEVQLEEARKAQSAAARPAPAPPPEPDAAVTPAPAEPAPVYPDSHSHAHPTDDSGADPGAVRAAPAPSVDERRS